MYSFTEEAVVEGDVDRIWAVATDVAHWAEWDPHSEAGIPFGKLRGRRTYEPQGDGTVRVSEEVEVHGPMGPLFKLIWEKGMRADMPRTFAALAREAVRRG